MSDDDLDKDSARLTRASSVYWAKVVQVRTWRDALAESVLDLLFYAIPLPSGEPRYHVLVGPHGSSDGVGVRTAVRMSAARSALAEVKDILGSTTPERAREVLELEF